MNTAPNGPCKGYLLCLGLLLAGCVPLNREHIHHGWVQITEEESHCHWELRGYNVRWICHV